MKSIIEFLLDLTGVPQLSSEAAGILLRAIDAAQLLGTQPVLVGVQPPVAQTLGDLDFDIRELVVLANLQAGLAYALDAQTEQSSTTPLQ